MPIPNPSTKSFTLIELIVVIIIVGILAAVGISQYSTTVEKSRLAEAKVRLGAMSKLAYEYYLNNGTLTGIANADVGADNTCSSGSFFRYWIDPYPTTIILEATRCTSNGKTPNATREYQFYAYFTPGTGYFEWRCMYTDNWSFCFGLRGG